MMYARTVSRLCTWTFACTSACHSFTRTVSLPVVEVLKTWFALGGNCALLNPHSKDLVYGRDPQMGGRNL